MRRGLIGSTMRQHTAAGNWCVYMLFVAKGLALSNSQKSLETVRDG